MCTSMDAPDIWRILLSDLQQAHHLQYAANSGGNTATVDYLAVALHIVYLEHQLCY